MRAAVSKVEIESEILPRFSSAFQLHELTGETCLWSSSSEGPVNEDFNSRAGFVAVVFIPTPAAVDARRRPVNQSSLPHSTILKSLSFRCTVSARFI
jgi:hypothetical protein